MKYVLSKINTNVFLSKKIVLHKIIQVISKYFVVLNLNVEHKIDILPSNFISKMFFPGPRFDKWRWDNIIIIKLFTIF